MLGLGPRGCSLRELLYCLFTLASKSTILLIKVAFILEPPERAPTELLRHRLRLIPRANGVLFGRRAVTNFSKYVLGANHSVLIFNAWLRMQVSQLVLACCILAV